MISNPLFVQEKIPKALLCADARLPELDGIVSTVRACAKCLRPVRVSDVMTPHVDRKAVMPVCRTCMIAVINGFPATGETQTPCTGLDIYPGQEAQFRRLGILASFRQAQIKVANGKIGVVDALESLSPS